MLVLSRKPGDSVGVGESDNCKRVVKVTVLEIRNSQVKLGFEGPGDIPIHRWEVWQRINGPNGELSKPAIAPKDR